MSMQLILDYLSQLEANNDRDWFHAHREQRLRATEAFEALLRETMAEIASFDADAARHDPASLCFKLNRDTRFSHDKSPYNPAFRAHIGPMGKQPVPVGYYLMIRPGNRSFLGGGLFADMFRDATNAVRDRIAAHPDEWNAIIHAPEFESRFAVMGTKLKNVPAGYDRAHPQAESLKHKSWYLEFPVSDAELLSAASFPASGATPVSAAPFPIRAAQIFRAMKPFNDFLNRALRDFKMPERR